MTVRSITAGMMYVRTRFLFVIIEKCYIHQFISIILQWDTWRRITQNIKSSQKENIVEYGLIDIAGQRLSIDPWCWHGLIV